jgi:hypothetical protein
MAVTPIDGTDSVGRSSSERCNTTAHDGRPAPAVPWTARRVWGPGDVLCELGADCEVFEDLDDTRRRRACRKPPRRPASCCSGERARPAERVQYFS